MFGYYKILFIGVDNLVLVYIRIFKKGFVGFDVGVSVGRSI